MQPDKSGIYDGHIGRIRSQLYNHVKFESLLGVTRSHIDNCYKLNIAR